MIDRRIFLLSSLAGLAQPGSVADPPADGAQVARSGDPAFDAWSRAFTARAVTAGLPEDLVRRELQDLTPDAAVVAADRKQPEFSAPVGDYIRSAVSDARVAEGRRRLQALQPRLQEIETRFGIEPRILVGVWAIESNFGQTQGGYDVVRSLATLAADGRRREWAEGELIDALSIIRQGRAARAQLKGSWAGAMGQTQFMPSAYLDTAVDGDGDGRIDIWSSDADALASAANLLRHYSWRSGQDWAREVKLPAGFDYGLSEGAPRPLAEWTQLGVVRADAKPWSESQTAAAGTVILPAGARGPAFLAFENHFVIRKYNNSVSYALAVGLLADGFAGGTPLTVAWPQETPLTRYEQAAAQSALAALGFDPGAADGLFGTQSRAALRKWQAARSLPADGHLTLDLVTRLMSEAGVHASPAPATPGAAPTPAA